MRFRFSSQEGLLMGKALNPRSNGGRPRQDGDRYPSGKLKPVKPNPKIVDIREAFGLTKLGQKFTPIEVAFHRGWIDEDAYTAAARYAALHRLAVVGGPSMPTQRDRSAGEGADVRLLIFAHLTDKEVEAIWDSAMPPARTPTDDEDRRAKATRQWTDWNAAMTPEQRQELFNVVILDSWPQWVIQRAAGYFGRAWETKRDLLLDGLSRSPQ